MEDAKIFEIRYKDGSSTFLEAKDREDALVRSFMAPKGRDKPVEEVLYHPKIGAIAS